MSLLTCKNWVAQHAAKLMTVGVLGAASLGLGGCTGVSAAEETKIIRISYNQGDDHAEYIALSEFGEKFKEATNGAYEVEIYPNSVLGDNGPVTEMIRTGALQMAVVPVSVPESYNSDFAIVSAPYLYEDLEELKTAAREGVFDELFTTTSKFNFEIAALYTSGARHIYTDKPIVEPEDLKGCKIRVQDSKAYIDMINYMGGVGTPLAQSEVYAAVQQNVIEGAENSEVVFSNYKHYEVSPYFNYTNHLIMTDMCIVNSDFLAEMDEETREIFDTLMKETTEREFEIWEQNLADASAKLADQGVTFVESNIPAFKERCQPLLEAIVNRSDMTRSIYEKIVEIQSRGETNE